jgi:hypothetical protein
MGTCQQTVQQLQCPDQHVSLATCRIDHVESLDNRYESGAYLCSNAAGRLALIVVEVEQSHRCPGEFGVALVQVAE